MADRLQDLAGMLAIPGLPAWVGFILLLAIVVSALSLLAMPYSVFGVKSRLEAIEAELADLRAEIRALLRQPPGAIPARATEEEWVAPPARGARLVEEPRITPPVPPPPARPSRRAEPRLDWPRSDASGS